MVMLNKCSKEENTSHSRQTRTSTVPMAIFLKWQGIFLQKVFHKTPQIAKYSKPVTNKTMERALRILPPLDAFKNKNIHLLNIPDRYPEE